MKKRNREINVFSIAALDLFASALGAFILISLIFMIFFSMTSRDSGNAVQVQEALVDAQTALQDAQKALTDTHTSLEATRTDAEDARTALSYCESELASSVDASALGQCRSDAATARRETAALAKELDQVRIPHLDVVICLDITGSMGNQIEELKTEITDLARVLDGLAPSAGIGIIAYGDIVYRQPIHHHPIVPTTSLASLRTFVDSLQPEMGNLDGTVHGLPEAVDLAIARAVRANWRSESERRYIIVITDAPAYDDKLQYTYRLAQDFARVGDQYVSGVMVRNTDAEAFLRQLARAGRGQFVNHVGGQSMIASVLLSIIDV